MTEKKLEDKTIEELGPEDFPKLKVVFSEGSFDEFDGTQEELDALVKEITDMIHSGELFEKSQSIDIDALLESDDPDDRALAEKLLRTFDDDQDIPRNLQ